MKKHMLKKVFCFILTLSMAFIVPDFSDENIYAVNENRTYYSYDAKSGAFIEEYELESLNTIDMPSARSGLIDDRTIDWSKQGVVKIFCTKPDCFERGTGFVVGEHVIATAAHVIRDSYIDNILLFEGSADDYIQLTPVEYHLPKKYYEEYQKWETSEDDAKKEAERESRCRDYALITVKEDLSDYMCFNLGVATDAAIENNMEVTVTGFPSTVYTPFNFVNDKKTNNMYTGTGILLDMSEYMSNYLEEYKQTSYIEDFKYIKNKDLIFCYDTYASAGNSGGPVYATESYDGNVYYTVVGINVAGGGSGCRMGVRMTTDLLHFYMNNSYLDW